MAWARDRNSGLPRYIGDLGRNERGSKCNCECVSCGAPLTAVNAAKDTFIRRPHFRHPAGRVQEGDCLILSARAALLQTLAKEGRLQLPRHRRSAILTGLSGQFYESWVEVRPEIVRVARRELCDSATAILTLQDGRELYVQLVGHLASTGTSSQTTEHLTATISVLVDDPEVAGMPPSQLRERLRLIIGEGTWCSHWNDPEMAQLAQDKARGKAEAALDWLEGSSSRESILHSKAKEILQRERRIRLPALNPGHVVGSRDSDVCRGHVPARNMALDSVRLEARLGAIRPDVLATMEGDDEWEAGPLLIEITVTNAIGDERLERIRRENIAAIEIDVSRMGGTVTEQEFTRLIVDEEAGKRWLHHPKLDAKLSDLLSLSPAESGRRYLEAIKLHGNRRALSDGSAREGDDQSDALTRVRDCATLLGMHGYPEAADDFLFRDRGNIIERILSIRDGVAVGYRLSTAWQVINAILQDSPRYLSWQTLYLIAIKVFRPELDEKQASRVENWRTEVVRSIRAGERTYVRSRKYDALLGLLFPELAEAIAKPIGKHGTNEKRDPPSTGSFVNSHEIEPWLRGRALREWENKNPQNAAAFWEARRMALRGEKTSVVSDDPAQHNDTGVSTVDTAAGNAASDSQDKL